MQTQTINSTNELLDFRKSLPEHRPFWFRGQSDVSWSLIPSFYRGVEHFNPIVDAAHDSQWLGQLERDVYREFDRRGRLFAPTEWDFKDPWHRLILAQHFGAPTRLVDWSMNVLIAAYFAVTDHKDRDGAIWCLSASDFPVPREVGRPTVTGGYRIEALNSCINRERLSFLMPVSHQLASNISSSSQPPTSQAIPSSQAGDPDFEGFMVLLEPPLLDGRIHSQKGLFTVYVSYAEEELVCDHQAYIERVEKNNSIQCLTKLVIPMNTKEEIRRSLKNGMIEDDDVFPDLPGLVKRLESQRKDEFESSGRRPKTP